MGDDACWYDPWLNELSAAETGGGSVRLRLSPYQMMILKAGNSGAKRPWQPTKAKAVEPDGGWALSMIPAGETEPAVRLNLPALTNLCAPDRYPHFSGTMLYECTFTLDAPAACLEIDLGQVYETAQVFLNGREIGVRIAPPYVFRAEGNLAQAGENRLLVRVVNTLGNKMRDSFSMSMPMEPTGLLGPVTLRF